MLSYLATMFISLLLFALTGCNDGAKEVSLPPISVKLVTALSSTALTSTSGITVTGKLVDTSNTSLANYNVLLDGVKVATTDSSGNYSFTTSTGGQVTFTSPTNVLYYGPIVPSDASGSFSVGTGPATPSTISSSTLSNTVTVSGTLVDTFNTALANYGVYLNGSKMATTDASGNYSFTTKNGGAIIFTSPSNVSYTGPSIPSAASGSFSVGTGPADTASTNPRIRLTYDDLMTGASSGPVNDSAFGMPANAASPTTNFSGTLTLSGLATTVSFKTIYDYYSYANTSDRMHLPNFQYQFVQNGNDLIPVTQGLSITGNAYWNYIIGPGKIWNESSDNGMDRASFPFAIVERNQNCTHNGVMTFLFDGSNVSKVRYQITQETCDYFKFDMWGAATASYLSQSIPNASSIKTAYATEVTNRLPTKPISSLATDFPSAGVNIANFSSKITDMTAYGLLINGTNYVSGCATRYGNYPYCESMRLPSFSTAKSSFAGIALMRLGQKYGSSIYNLKIGNYVSEAAAKSSLWNNVTFNNTIDMATGFYLSAKDDSQSGSDEAADPYGFFSNSNESYASKMNAALSYSYQKAPGTQWVYHTSDTFLVTRAMNNYLVQQQGAGADIFNMLQDEVFTPLHLSAGALTTLRSDNSASGAPLGGYGLFWTQDDIAKVAMLLNNQNGMIGGSQVLNAQMLADSMQKNPSDRGIVTTASTTGTPSYFYYNNAFWAKQFTSADSSKYTCSFWVPYMSGHGGISVIMMPNGVTYYYFSDNDEFYWFDAVGEANKLKPMCQ